jgi:hypothetical protein
MDRIRWTVAFKESLQFLGCQKTPKRWVIVYKGMVAVREENRRGSLPNEGGLSLRGLLAPYCEEVG